MGIIFLTSTGLTNTRVRDEISRRIGGFQKKRVAIVTTASSDNKKRHYCRLAQKRLKNFGCSEVNFVDLKTAPNYNFSAYDIIYVSGGNTFRLLKFARAADFKKTINDLLNRGGTYIGVSAGSYIMCPSIEMAAWKPDPDRNYFGLTDFTGLNFVPFLLVVHYNSDMAGIIKQAIITAKYPVKILTDQQAITVENEKVSLVGEGGEMKI